MSTAELHLVEGGALARVVAVALRMEQHEQIDRWEFADDVKDAVEELCDSPQNGFEVRDGLRTGLNEALDKVQYEIKKGGAPDVASRETIRGAFHTATAWPPETRVDGAGYWAHYELRAKDFERSRETTLKKLVREEPTHRVGTKQVRLWKSNRRSVDLTPRDERLSKSLRRALVRWASPQKFSQLDLDQQTAAVKILTQLANEIALGEFS